MYMTCHQELHFDVTPKIFLFFYCGNLCDLFRMKAF